MKIASVAHRSSEKYVTVLCREPHTKVTITQSGSLLLNHSRVCAHSIARLPHGFVWQLGECAREYDKQQRNHTGSHLAILVENQ